MNIIRNIEFLRQVLISEQSNASLDSLQLLLTKITDWENLVSIAKRNGLLPILYFQLKNFDLLKNLPVYLIEELSYTYRHSALESLKRKAVYIEIATILKNRNIPFLTLKGMALEQTIYLQAGLRPMIDIDILISEELLQIALNEFLKTGAQQIPIYENEWIASFSHQTRPLIFKGITIELHKNIVDKFDNWQINSDEVWKQAIPLTIHEANTFTFSAEFMLVYLCQHAYNTIKGGRIKLVSYVDIYKIIESGNIHWNELTDIVKFYDIEKSVFHSLGFVGYFFQSQNIPIWLQSSCSKYCMNPNLVLEIIEKGEANTIKEHYIEKFNRIGSIIGKLRYLLGKACPNRDYLEYFYGKEHNTFLVHYYFKHIFKLFACGMGSVFDYIIPKRERYRDVS